MLKSIGFALAALLVCSCLPAAAYNVILKNGKVLKGTLISETDEMIVFKDEQGLQFSLKKSTMDLDKMKEANAPPPQPETAPAAESSAAPVADDTKKAAKVYTAADVEKLRKKYKNIANIGPAGESIDASTPAGYYRGLMEAVTEISAAMNDIDSMLNAMNTSVEVAASTGRNPNAAFRQYKSSKAFTDLDKSINAGISELEAIRDNMQSPPANYAGTVQYLNKAVEAIYSYYNAVARFDGKSQMGDFRLSLKQYTDTVENAVAQIQGAPAPPGEPDTPNPDQQQSQDQQQ